MNEFLPEIYEKYMKIIKSANWILEPIGQNKQIE